ncbi:hypothetical protein Ndes2526B_g01403 [Nannochloris sp. 'desiccata']|nr:hypothetical protein KSW81_004270 [Chlorella desiccata (nom. nud.)]KAH7624149.1 putative GPN-loop GTPase QQT1 [Chlorella desiccata (nom. nud.)]
MPFGQLIVGPPGSGKTTYCAGMQQFFALTGRKVAIINLDPANDPATYDCAVDIRDLVSLDSVQKELGLGPNGGLIYCMEYLDANLDWLQEQLSPLAASDHYFLFDCPGQVELFTLHTGMKHIITTLADTWHYRLAAVQLMDAHLCSDPAKYMAALVLALSTMLHLELPQVNALSKFDLAEQYGALEFTPDFYLRAQGLDHLADAVEESLPPRFAKLTREMCNVVEDFGLVGFTPLAIEDKESVAHIVALVDKANGFAFAGLARTATGEKQVVPPELQYSAGLVEDPEDLWDRMAEKYRIHGSGKSGLETEGTSEGPRGEEVGPEILERKK